MTRSRDMDAAIECANNLAALGFAISSTTPRGVNFSGPPELFESVFQSSLDLQAEPRFLDKPALPGDLSRSARAIYLPSQPTYFE